MHTGEGVEGPRGADLTARAQIRDAAIECFALHGFRASFRDIASRAGVSPALITHHFGSKAELRRVCDAEVLDRYRSLKTAAIPLLPTGFADFIGTVDHDQAVVTVYILRVLTAGGHAAADFTDHLAGEVRRVLAEYEAAGLVRTTRDEDARAQFYARVMLGSVLVLFLTTTWTTPEEFVDVLLARNAAFILPMLELASEGLLTSPDFLDQYLQTSGDTSDAPSQSGSQN